MRKKPKRGRSFKNDSLWILLLRSFVLGVLFIGATGRIFVLYPQIAFFFLGFFISLFLPRISLSGPVSVAVSLLSACLAQIEGLGIPLIMLFFLFPILSFLGSFAGEIFKGRFNRKHLVLFLLILISFNFLVQGLVVSKGVAQKASIEPPAEGYSFDPVFFLKVYYLMKGGEGFYKAFDQGFREDARFDKPYTTVAGWRSPVLFWMWSKAFPTGAEIVYVFIFLSLVALSVSYYLARRISDEVSALVAPALLSAYFLYATVSWWFMELEFWASFLAIFSAFFFYQRKEKLSLGFALLAGSIREWLVSNVLAGMVEKLSKREWRKSLLWIFSFLFLALFYVVNSIIITRYLRGAGFEPSAGLKGRIGGGGIDFILYTLQFCAQFFLNPGFTPYLAFILALLGAVYLLREKDYFLTLLFLFPLLAFLFVGSGKGLGDPPGWNDYYNASFMPLAFIIAPAFWKVFLLKSSPRKGNH